MDLTRFKACAGAYGADRRRWPAPEHGLFDRFAETPEGAAILAEAERTDRFLDALEVAGPDAALAETIAGRARPRRRRGLWWQATAFAASAIIGFVLGFAQVHDDGNGDVVTQLLLGPTSVREIGL
jgi:ferric-dicitrate binding protein FerR (iron transport regulator)